MKFGVLIALSFLGVGIAKATDPIERRVVELHITEVEYPASDTTKQHKPKRLTAGRALCSGEFIDATGDILTAKHCTDGADKIDVVVYDQQIYRATIVSTSAVHDLALLHIDRANTEFFPLAEDVYKGEPVALMGSPLGETSTLNVGVVAKLNGDTLLVDASVLPGDSGCPLFNQNEQLVGVVTAGYIVLFGTTHLNIAQSLDAVRFFLTQVRHDGKL